MDRDTISTHIASEVEYPGGTTLVDITLSSQIEEDAGLVEQYRQAAIELGYYVMEMIRDRRHPIMHMYLRKNRTRKTIPKEWI